MTTTVVSSKLPPLIFSTSCILEKKMTSSKIIFLQLHSLHSLQCCEQCCSVYAFHSRVLECVCLFKFLCALWDVHMSPFADCQDKIAAPVSGWAAVQLCRRNTMCVFVFLQLGASAAWWDRLQLRASLCGPSHDGTQRKCTQQAKFCCREWSNTRLAELNTTDTNTEWQD